MHSLAPYQLPSKSVKPARVVCQSCVSELRVRVACQNCAFRLVGLSPPALSIRSGHLQVGQSAMTAPPFSSLPILRASQRRWGRHPERSEGPASTAVWPSPFGRRRWPSPLAVAVRRRRSPFCRGGSQTRPPCALRLFRRRRLAVAVRRRRLPSSFALL